MELHLLRPYSFTHLPSPSSSRRSSPVQSQVVRNPETGNEHLVMRFWIHGRRMDEDETTMGWINARWREGKVWVRQVDGSNGERERGEENRVTTSSASAPVKEERGWISSLFGALRPSLPRQTNLSTPLKNLPPPGTFTSGEGRVDFYRNPENGTYEMLTLTVDVPGTRKANQRAVLYWSESERVAKESILEGKSYRITF
jgi:import inner membrane translocase subunit TIM21